ncbi:hypothetical protein TRVL_07847 [Trypanosoma vivax]|uniref:Uncharacterized protein n=1 Tax=Trypanosoma vivax (strain Y486) TaxID=1055687 RepID=G0U320_TRYVY|nr:hypothetical protein TRVL_07847 [Trypanosoma vivax]CCC50675.1 hypothetical protein, conserved (unlikely) [Trypanosoma vivax Y486]
MSCDAVIESDEIELLNVCLSSAHALHLFVARSLTVQDVSEPKKELRSELLDASVQTYLQQLLRKYSSTASMRRRLKSVRSLYYLQCLTDERVREEFIRAAAHPLFPLSS